ncbi:MAG: carboxypeptidase-like regulatory domain-containing protein [Bryobacterales bacterium]
MATYLVGRAVGAGASGVIAAAMFPKADPAQSFRTRLSSDDLAFLAEAYPASGEAARRGAIVGTVSASLTGTPLTGVLVTAIDPFTGTTVQTVTSLTDGTYRINVPAVPVGRYFVYAESLDGPVIPPEVQLIDLSSFRTDVRVEFFGGNAVPTRLDLPPGRTLRADISVQTGASALRIDQLGVGPAGGSGPRSGSRPARLRFQRVKHAM